MFCFAIPDHVTFSGEYNLLFLRVMSHGVKWKNKMYKLKRRMLLQAKTLFWEGDTKLYSQKIRVASSPTYQAKKKNEAYTPFSLKFDFHILQHYPITCQEPMFA